MMPDMCQNVSDGNDAQEYEEKVDIIINILQEGDLDSPVLKYMSKTKRERAIELLKSLQATEVPLYQY